MRGYIFAAAAFVLSSQVSCDWTGSGELTCYGHLSTDVSQAGGQYLEAGKMTCTPIEWPYPAQDLGPEAMFFKPNGGAEFEIWAWDYHEPNIPWAECDGDVWYQNSDMGAGRRAHLLQPPQRPGVNS